MDTKSVVIVVLFLALAYFVFVKFYQPEKALLEALEGEAEGKKTVSAVEGSGPAVPGQTVKEVVYTQDYYPWWRSTRWWNYDGWLYQKPYYNYWRRPYYYNYWYSGRPLIIGGKRYYHRQFW